MLAKKYRLTKHGSFNFVYRKGSPSRAGLISLVYVTGGKGVKVGFSVPNKVGKAVYRNKVKRRMRAFMQSLIGKMKPSQLVFSAGKGVCDMTYAEISSAMDKLVRKAGLIK